MIHWSDRATSTNLKSLRKPAEHCEGRYVPCAFFSVPPARRLAPSGLGLQSDVRMRLQFTAIVILGLPAVIAAQSPASAPSAFAPLPSIGLPLPRIGLPLPRIGLPPPIEAQRDSSGGHPPGGTDNQHRSLHPREGFRSERTVVYFVPAFRWDDPYAGQTAPPALSVSDGPSERGEPKPLTGSLRLNVQPERGLQVHVDGYYVGTPDDFSGELELEAGPHNIEIAAPGHETLHIDVKITPHRSITYRGALKPAGTKATPDPIPPTTFYFIPGCYVGNVPPKDAGLPPTCDQSRVITLSR